METNMIGWGLVIGQPGSVSVEIALLSLRHLVITRLSIGLAGQ